MLRVAGRSRQIHVSLPFYDFKSLVVSVKK